MQEAKHTPGPWEADSNGKIWGDTDNEALDGDSPLLAEMFGNGREQRANARLIAAAPELLYALEMVRDADEDCRKDGLPTMPAIARAKIDRAIAKATAANGSGNQH